MSLLNSNAPRMFHILVYDISDNRRRSKIAKLMESMGYRVQGSVFEGYLTKTELETMLIKTRKIIDLEKDSIRVYPLCSPCRNRLIILGQGKINNPPGLVII